MNFISIPNLKSILQISETFGNLDKNALKIIGVVQNAVGCNQIKDSIKYFPTGSNISDMVLAS